MSSYQPYDPHVTTGYTAVPGIEPESLPDHSAVEPYGLISDRHEFQLRPEHPQAGMILVLGILSLVLAGILGPFAWVLGNRATNDCREGKYSMTDSLKTGRILGIITTVILGMALLITIIGLAAFTMFISSQ